MLEVDRANINHLDALAPLFDAYRVFYGRKTNLNGARTFLEARLQRKESVIFLAELDSQPAGFTQLYPLFSSVNMSRVWLLNDLYIAESVRHRGVASALLDAARRHAEQTGASGLSLETDHDNRAAQALYEREGWRRIDEHFWYELGL